MSSGMFSRRSVQQKRTFAISADNLKLGNLEPDISKLTPNLADHLVCQLCENCFLDVMRKSAEANRAKLQRIAEKKRALSPEASSSAGSCLKKRIVDKGKEPTSTQCETQCEEEQMYVTSLNSIPSVMLGILSSATGS